MPILSIITINLNNAVGLRNTIESIINQAITDLEYIIIDGGSTDGSLDVIKEFANKITYWISEPDKGIYNAMNKGILRAKGEYLLFLNSGDCLINSEVLSGISEYLTGGADIFCGAVSFCLNNEKVIKEPFNKLAMSKLFLNTLPHQGCLIKRKLFSDIGLYNENLKIVSDWEFLVKCARSGVLYQPVDKILVQMQPGGISVVNKNLYLKERESIKKQLFQNYFDDIEELLQLRERRLKVRIRKVFTLAYPRKLLFAFRRRILNLVK